MKLSTLKTVFLLKAVLLIVLLFALPAGAENADKATTPIPAGSYTLDKSHASLIFSVSHLGFSSYTSSFGDFNATLQFDPKKLERSTVTATINPRSLNLPSPPPGFTEELQGKQWLDVANFPNITFNSTDVEVTGSNTMKINGLLNLHGIKKNMTLAATFNGGYAGHPMDPSARIGFSAVGTFKRSDFGIDYGIPAPGSNMGVGDEITVMIEAEFNGPPLKP